MHIARRWNWDPNILGNYGHIGIGGRRHSLYMADWRCHIDVGYYNLGRSASVYLGGGMRYRVGIWGSR